MSGKVDSTLEIIAKRVIGDSAEESKAKYQKPVLEILDWWYSVEYRYFFSNKFSFLRNYADKLYSTLTYTPEIGALMRDPKKLAVAKRIGQSSLSASVVDKALSKVEELHDKYGEGAVDEFLKKADSFIDKKEEFNERLEIGQNIETLLREALYSEGIDINSDKSNSGSYDIEVYKMDNPEKTLKLEVKSYKNDTTYDFKFAISQILESNSDSSNYIVCTLERPSLGVATIEYLKTELKIHKNLSEITSDYFEKVVTFSSIYNESKIDLIPLEIPCI